ncbi:MAG: sigma-70 family RNA polymerase sigma factor [Flavobacterium sp. JAD_PAG50586_2]|nr:MAG: sigma-70 family RNA polymerase sigma factor [Flavobacterium sp. JAD_PAG50586_2]
MNIEEIIKGCKNNNLVHQKALYTLYEKKLFNLSLKYCTSFSDAEDNLHDSFIEIFSSISTYKGIGSFEGWMKKITINKAISKFKSSIQLDSLDSKIYAVSDTEIEINPGEIDLGILLKMIQNLPNQYRLVFNLYELDDHSHKEIAHMLNISEGTSKSNLHKAKVILKEKILEFTHGEAEQRGAKPKKAQNGI